MSEQGDDGARPRRRRSRRGGRGRRRGGRRGPALAAGEVVAPAPAAAPIRRPRRRSACARSSRRRSSTRRRRARSRRSQREAAQRLGIEQLRPEQEQVVADVLAGRDVLHGAADRLRQVGLLPGAVDAAAEARGGRVAADRAACRTSTRGCSERGVRVRAARRHRARQGAQARRSPRSPSGGPLLVMTTPETLGGTEAREALVGERRLAGRDRRGALHLGVGLRLPARVPAPRRSACASSARRRSWRSPPLRPSWCATRSCARSACAIPEIVAASPHRSNLAFEVLRCEGDARFRALLRLARRLRRPGIIYCATRARGRRRLHAAAALRDPRASLSRRHDGRRAGDRASSTS